MWLALQVWSGKAGVYPYLKSSIWGTFCDVNCMYSETQVMLKLGRRATGHLVMLIEIRVHLIRIIYLALINRA